MMDKQNLFDIIPQEYDKRYFIKDEWTDYNSWLERGGGTLEKEGKVFHILFSSSLLKRTPLNRWGLFSLSAYQSGDNILINDFYEIFSSNFQPSVKTIAAIYSTHPYLTSLSPETIYFFSGMETHKELLQRLVDLVREGGIARPLNFYYPKLGK